MQSNAQRDSTTLYSVLFVVNSTLCLQIPRLRLHHLRVYMLHITDIHMGVELQSFKDKTDIYHTYKMPFVSITRNIQTVKNCYKSRICYHPRKRVSLNFVAIRSEFILKSCSLSMFPFTWEFASWLLISIEPQRGHAWQINTRPNGYAKSFGTVSGHETQHQPIPVAVRKAKSAV